MSKKSDLPEKTPMFVHYLHDKGITQKQIASMTYMTVVTVNKIVTTGIANKSNVLLLSLVLGIKMDELIEMLKTQENLSHWDNTGSKSVTSKKSVKVSKKK